MNPGRVQNSEQRGLWHVILFSLTLSSQACFHLLCPCSVETTTGRQKQNHGLLLRNQGSQQDSQCRIWALISGKAWLPGLFCFRNSCSRTGRGPRVTVSPGLDTANTSAQSGPRSRQCQHPLSGRRIKSPGGSLSGTTKTRSADLCGCHGGSSPEDTT